MYTIHKHRDLLVTAFKILLLQEITSIDHVSKEPYGAPTGNESCLRLSHNPNIARQLVKTAPTWEESCLLNKPNLCCLAG